MKTVSSGSILSVESNQNVGVQDEKCGVQNRKMWSSKQHLYTSRNSLFWVL